QMYMSALAIVRPQLQTGKIKLLAVTNSVRAPAAPDVPTVKEAGFPDLTFDWPGRPLRPTGDVKRAARAHRRGYSGGRCGRSGDRRPPRRHRPTPQRWRAGRVRAGDRGTTREDRGDCQGPRHEADAVMSP